MKPTDCKYLSMYIDKNLYTVANKQNLVIHITIVVKTFLLLKKKKKRNKHTKKNQH